MIKFNRRVEKLVASSTLAITARAKALKAEGADVVNFAGGEPDFDTPDFIKEAAIQAIHDGITKYTPSIGMPKLRKRIAQKFKEENQIDYSPKQIAVSCGAKHSLFCVIQVLIDEGDEVLLPVPYWVSYPQIVNFAGGTPKFIETKTTPDLKITPELLKENITDKTKALVLNSPSNPAGVLYSKNELEAIAEICVKHNIYIISDEIYEKLVYDTARYTSIASLGKDIYDLTITVNGVSKAFSMTGWRIGYCGANEEIVASMKKLQDHSTSNPCAISQMAALKAFDLPKNIMNNTQETFAKRREEICSGIGGIDGLSYIRPQGAFYLFCDFSKMGDSLTVAKDILEKENVAMIPGDGFGTPGFMRLSYATSSEKIQEGVKRIANWVKNNH